MPTTQTFLTAVKLATFSVANQLPSSSSFTLLYPGSGGNVRSNAAFTELKLGADASTDNLTLLGDAAATQTMVSRGTTYHFVGDAVRSSVGSNSASPPDFYVGAASVTGSDGIVYHGFVVLTDNSGDYWFVSNASTSVLTATADSGSFSAVTGGSNVNAWILTGGTPTSQAGDPAITGVIDDVGPRTGTIANGGSTDDTQPTLVGTGDAGSFVNIYDGSTVLGTVTVANDGIWRFTVPTLTNGITYGLSVTAYNQPGAPYSDTSPAYRFTVTPDLSPVPCFALGTRIATPKGETRVEDLRIGDRVLTGSGRAEPVKWIGRRSYTAAQVRANPHLRQVIVRRDAIAPGMPQRDLAVSALHGLYLKDCLIPAAALVNGVSIVRDETCAAVAYIHIELANHDIVFADGMPAETFVDDESRILFDNADEYGELYGAMPSHRMAPGWRVNEGVMLEAIRGRIASRAGALCYAGKGPLRGHVERISDDGIEGWVIDEATPTAPVELELLIRGQQVMTFPANRYRVDLDYHGIGTGCGGFRIDLSGLTAHTAEIQVRRVSDGRPVALPHRWDAAA